MTYFETPDDALKHYGVKGMKWGSRKSESGGGSSGKTKESRKDYKARTKKEADDFYSKKMNKILDEVMKDPDLLVQTRLPGQAVPMMTTGKEFAGHMLGGGAFDVKITEVYARQEQKGGQYVVNEEPIGTYKKTARQK